MPSRYIQRKKRSPNPAEEVIECKKKSRATNKKTMKSPVRRKSPRRNVTCQNNYNDGKKKVKVHSPFDPEVLKKAISPYEEEVEQNNTKDKDEDKVIEMKPIATIAVEDVTNQSKLTSMKGLVSRMNVMSCKEMREYVTSTSLTADEKIKLLESNSSGNRQLLGFITAQHWNLKELKFFSEAGKFMVSTFSDKLHEAKNFVLGGYDENDPDCRYLNDLLIELKTERDKKASKKEQSTFQKLKTFGWDFAMGTIGMLSKGVKLAFQKGMDLWTYITRDPKTAYFALLVLKNLKKKVCRDLGKLIGYTKESSTLGSLRVWYEKNVGVTLPDETSFQQAKEWLTDVTSPIFKGKIIEFCGKSINAIFDKFGNPLITGITLTISTFVPYFGATLAEGLKVVMNIALSETKEAVEMSVEALAYQTNTYNAFSMFFEVINPKVCLDDLIKESTSGTKQEKSRRNVVNKFEGKALEEIDKLNVTKEKKEELKDEVNELSNNLPNKPKKNLQGSELKVERQYRKHLVIVPVKADAVNKVNSMNRLTDKDKEWAVFEIGQESDKFYNDETEQETSSTSYGGVLNKDEETYRNEIARIVESYQEIQESRSYGEKKI